MPFLKLLWQWLRSALLVLAAIVLFIEEWGWKPLAAWAGRMASWPPLAWVEARIRRASPRVALALFLVPGIALIPIKLLALWLIGEGHVWLGVSVILAAKLLGTALVGRLFVLVEPQLMRFARFARALAWWRITKARVTAAVWNSPASRSLRSALRKGRRRLKRAWRKVRRRLRS